MTGHFTKEEDLPKGIIALAVIFFVLTFPFFILFSEIHRIFKGVK